jgi:ankyrin repeat domain-containing protein 50
MCFVYYNYKMSESQDPPRIAAALIKQLCRKKDIIPLWLLKFKNDALSPALAGTALSIIRLVQEMNFREVYIIIDALDECQKHYRPRMIQLLNEVMNSIPCAKIFVTSRRESDIERAFTENSTPTIQIQIQARNVATDIRSYVESEVKRLRKGHYGNKLFLSSDALEARVISTLVEQADGM